MRTTISSPSPLMRSMFALALPWRLRAVSSSWVFVVLLAAVFVGGAAVRFRLPQLPLFDPDFWGYLNPALSKLRGGPFEHTGGRDTLYPGFLYGILALFGDLRAISIAQHLLGLAGGGLMLLAFRRLCLLHRPPERSQLTWPERCAGLLMMAAYLTTPSVVQYEHSVRPEAIFPFFVILSIWLNLEFIRSRWVVPAPRAAAVTGAAGFIVTVIVYKLKPSFGFAVGIANLPMAVSLLGAGMSWRRKLAMVGVAGAVSFFALLLPEQIAKKSDIIAARFLPETLLVIHADLIRDQLARDIADQSPTPFPPELLRDVLARLDTLLPLARKPENRPFRGLGFNPDYLMYVDNLLNPLVPRKAEGERLRERIAYYYYFRTWRRQPLGMLRKIVIQLGFFYQFEGMRYFLARDDLSSFAQRNPLAVHYGKVEEMCDGHARLVKQLERSSVSRTLRADSLRLSRNESSAFSQGPYLGVVEQFLESFYWLILLAVLATALGVMLRTRLSAAWVVPTLATLLLYGYNFGNNLTLATVHTMSPRYVENQLVITLLASVAGLLFLWLTARRVARFAFNRLTVKMMQEDQASFALPRLTLADAPDLTVSFLVLGKDDGGVARSLQSNYPQASVFTLGAADHLLDLLDVWGKLRSETLIVVRDSAGDRLVQQARCLLEAFADDPADQIVFATGHRAESRWLDALLRAVFGRHPSDGWGEARLLSRRCYQSVPFRATGEGGEIEVQLALHAVGMGYSWRELPPLPGGAGIASKVSAGRPWRLVFSLCLEHRPLRFLSLVAAALFLLGAVIGYPSMQGIGKRKSQVRRAEFLTVAATLWAGSLLTAHAGLVAELAARRRRADLQLRERNTR